ncbi:MAG: AAA family ATPase [Candidatus Paceibacterota bacterium]
MILEKIKLNNFMCYYGINEITFEKGLNIIAGDNGYGKSKIFDAIYWVVYDKCHDVNYKEPRSTELIKETIISDRHKHEAEDGVISCSVSLIFLDEKKNNRYTLKRIFKGTKNGKEFTFGNKSKLSVKEKVRNLDSQFINSKDDIDRILNKIMPLNIRDYMWFQGEAIDRIIDFKNSDSLLKAINLLSDISTFDEINNIAETFKKKTLGKLNQKKQEQSDDQEASERIKNSIESMVEKITKSELDLADKENDLFEHNEELAITIEKIQAAEEIKHLNIETNKLYKSIESDSKYLETLKMSLHQKMFSELWILKGMEEISEEFKRLYKKYQNDRSNKRAEILSEKKASEIVKNIGFAKLPANMPRANYLEQMLEDEQCYVCGQKALKESEAYALIEAHLDKINVSEVSIDDSEVANFNFYDEFDKLFTNSISVKNKIGKIDDNIENYENIVSNLKNELDQNQNEYNRKSEILNSLLRQESLSVMKAEEITEKIKTLNTLIRSTEKKIEKIKYEIDFQNDELNELNRSLDKLVTGDIDDVFLKGAEIGQKLHDLSKSTRERVFAELIEKLEIQANRHYKEMTEGNKAARGIIKIKKSGRNYSPDIVNNSGESLPGMNTSNMILIKLATIMAIISARESTRDNELYTLISDAPLSALGENYSLGFCTTVSNVYKQSIITSKEFYVDKDLQNTLLNSEHINLGSLYEITPNLVEEERESRNKLQTKIDRIK